MDLGILKTTGCGSECFADKKWRLTKVSAPVNGEDPKILMGKIRGRSEEPLFVVRKIGGANRTSLEPFCEGSLRDLARRMRTNNSDKTAMRQLIVKHT